ncbi:MAG TPA: FAD-dependent oxidoreductase [Candidatus Thermoplasmatota archaeon]|nr:FAD-dependent oxidoreductase [Candidatus Thermoplasmatota archaeon]
MAEYAGTRSYWLDTTPTPEHPPLAANARADVAILGGGITGLLAAYYLTKAGKRVVLLERYGIAQAETGHTTAHVTYVVDTRLKDLVRIHDRESAKASWDSSVHAINLIETIAREEGIECGFERIDGFLYGPERGDRRLLEQEQDYAHEFGYRAERVDPASFPFPAEAVLRFPRQAKFHPRKFLLGVADRVTARGGLIHGNTEVVEVDPQADDAEGRVRITTATGHEVRADWVLVTTNVPFVDRVRMFTKLFPYRSYVIGAYIPAGILKNALYWDTLDPYHYIRVEPQGDRDYVILGGEDHKVGQEENPEEAWTRLETYLREHLRVDVEVVHRWSGQIIENLDYLPYIGVNPGSPDHELIATAYSGNGMTFGALAAWMLAERVMGRATPWDRLYDPARKSARQIKDYLAENKDFPLELAKGHLTPHRPETTALAPGEGTIVRAGTKKVAVCCDASGELRAVDAVCTHLGCLVAWNRAEQSWDCPCHGSRFTPSGEVLNGPAYRPLDQVAVPEEFRAHQARGRRPQTR